MSRDDRRNTKNESKTHVVHSRPSAPLLLVAHRQPPYILHVILRPQQYHMIRHLHARLKVILHLLVQAPHLRDLTRIAPHLVHNLLLRLDHRLQHGRLRVRAHRRIVVPTHADGDDVLVRLRALGALGEELVQGSVVGRPAPRRIQPLHAPGPNLRPLLRRAHHGLGVRRAHDDAVRIGERLVPRVVNVEHGVPHGGPQVVGAAPQQQLEHVRVEAGAERRVVRRLGVFCVDPAGQRGGLVVDEEAAVLDGGGLLDFGGAQGEDGGVGFWGHVGEPVPGGHADLLGDVVEAVDGAALVAAWGVSGLCGFGSGNDGGHGDGKVRTGDDQGFRGAVGRVFDDGADIGFPFSFDLADIEFPALDEVVDQTRVSNCTRDDSPLCLSRALPRTPILTDPSNIEDDLRAPSDGSIPRRSHRAQRPVRPRDASKVDGDVVRRAKHTRPIRGIEHNVNRLTPRGKRQTSVSRRESDGGFAVLRQRFGAGEGGRERQDAQQGARYHPHDERLLNPASRKCLAAPHQGTSSWGGSFPACTHIYIYMYTCLVELERRRLVPQLPSRASIALVGAAIPQPR